ncbi:GTPase-activating protein [Lithohypha guttulata]|uniref:GTPase-activating protein n=1 Tax=Lithohypha guttulata TaxID=1690604 RepID=A0AAN7QPI7_9EURO|nr:GTPase-activating protein [Lithohypha guttulata]
MDIVRDSAFGKLVRLATQNLFFQYPEEKDISTCKSYLRSQQLAIEEEKHAVDDDPEAFGLFTVLSQASRHVTRTRSQAPEGQNESSTDQVCKSEEQLIVDWKDNADPENPQNWSLIKKSAVSSLIWLLTFSIYIGSAIYSPGIPGVSDEFGVSQVAATLGLTLFVLGYGLGPMVWSPLSELPAVGRAPVYMLTLFVFVFFEFAVIYAKNFGMVMAFRFLTGFIGSPALATGVASMGDIWSPKLRDYMIVIWGMFAISAPVLGPSIGGFAASAYGWRWTIWPLLWISALTLVLLFFFLPETYAPTILTSRAKRVRKLTKRFDYQAEAEIEIQHIDATRLIFEALVRPFQLTFLEPIVFLMDLYIALIYGILYIWFEAFPIVFQETHGFNSGESGLAFLGILVSTCCITVPAYFVWKHLYQSRHFDENGNIAPEHQLPPACFGAFCLPISLFFFGWTGQFASVHWIVPIIASMFFAMGGCLIFNAIFCYQAHAYPKYAASVLAGNDCFRSCFGAGFPLFATAMFHNLKVGWACSLLGFLTILFVPYPFLLHRYGRQIRLKSRWARHDL